MPGCSSSKGHALILLVDDDACFRRALAIALRLDGHSVFEASTGSEALALARAHSFSLALVDLLLGSERGEVVLEQIERISPSTRLASMSGRPGVASALAAHGKAAHLEKPLVAAEVLALL
jgi:ActR/RegA family two-component response regulator